MKSQNSHSILRFPCARCGKKRFQRAGCTGSAQQRNLPLYWNSFLRFLPVPVLHCHAPHTVRSRWWWSDWKGADCNGWHCSAKSACGIRSYGYIPTIALVQYGVCLPPSFLWEAGTLWLIGWGNIVSLEKFIKIFWIIGIFFSVQCLKWPCQYY